MSGYQAALASVAFASRPDRARVRVTGKDPFGMLQGILTNSVPAAPRVDSSGVASGSAPYAVILTPKGRMITDLRVVRGPRTDEEGLLLDMPASARAGVLSHLAMYVPPRLAKAADVSDGTASLTVAGPGAAEMLSREAFGLRIETADLSALTEGEWRWMETGEAGVLAIRSGDLAAPAFDVVVDRAWGEALRTRLLEAGAPELTPDELDVLRVEAGRPAWGADMNEETIPPEAGIDTRAIDHNKGCYTGQEVIVRIRDRGHVNRRLRGLRLGRGTLPERGAQLWAEGRDQPVGAITSAVASPRAGGGLALAYVRREVEAPSDVRVGAPDGLRAAVVELAPEWWRT